MQFKVFALFVALAVSVAAAPAPAPSVHLGPGPECILVQEPDVYFCPGVGTVTRPPLAARTPEPLGPGPKCILVKAPDVYFCPGEGTVTRAPLPARTALPEVEERGVGPVCINGTCPITCHTKFGC